MHSDKGISLQYITTYTVK